MEKSQSTRFGKSIVATIIASLSICVQPVLAAYDGTPVTPSQVTESNYADFNLSEAESSQYIGYYAITSAEELYGFAALVNSGDSVASAVLINDITVNENVLKADGTLNAGPFADWTPIGTSAKGFGGRFDGRMHTLSGLYLYKNTTYVGLFGLTKQFTDCARPQIDNVLLKDCYFRVGGTVGAMAGWCNSTDFHNCYVQATIEKYSSSFAAEKVGGLIGWTKLGFSATNCGTNCKVTGNSYSGGILGGQDGGVVVLKDCYSNTLVKSASSTRGGIAGSVSVSTDLRASNCYYLPGVASISTYNAVGAPNYNYDTTDKSPAAMHKVSDAEIKSGKLAWLLNRGKTENVAWVQELGVDTVPVLSKVEGQRSKVVYVSMPCQSTFANSQEALEHHYDNGFCIYCDDYEPAPQNATDRYYEISNAGQLYWMAKQVNGGSSYCYENNWYWKGDASIDTLSVCNIRLMCDIKVNEGVSDGTKVIATTAQKKAFRLWVPIGRNASTYWMGDFDGQDHIISGLFQSQKNTYVGLFGYIGQESDVAASSVKNISLQDSYMYGSSCVAGIAGCAYRTTFSRCMNGAYVNSENSTTNRAGGIAGFAYSAVFESCGNTGDVCGYAAVGGIAGDCGKTKVTIRNCFNTGYVKGTDFETGAILGEPWSNITHAISNCYYLENSAFSRVSQNGVGYSVRSYSNPDTPTSTHFATWEDFKSGRVTWELNKHKTEDVVWVQELGVDTVPGLSKVDGQRSKVVYACMPCQSTFANSQESLAHRYDNGFCTGCDDYEPAPKSATDGYYEITNAGHLYWMAKQVNGGMKYNYRDSWYWRGDVSIDTLTVCNIRLMCDIKVNEGVSDGTKVIATTVQKKAFRLWVPIGRNASTYWMGDFDGQDHTISGLYQSEKLTCVGLFGYIGQESDATASTVSNLSLQDSYMYGSSNVAGIAGCAYRTTFSRCMNGAYVNSENTTTNRAGGIAGFAYSAVFESCGNTGDVYGYAAIGGIAGDCGKTKVTIQNCFNTGYVKGTDFETGAILGEPWSNITHAISNCYYLENSAFSRVSQNGVGYSVRSYSNPDKANQTTPCAWKDFKSGKICYRLNGSIVNSEWQPRDTEFEDVWYQRLSKEVTPKPMKSDSADEIYKVIALSDNYYYNSEEAFVNLVEEIEYDLLEPIAVDSVRFARPQSSGRIWGTLCVPFDIKTDDEVQYYQLNTQSGDVLKFSRLDEVPAGTPVLYRRRHSRDSLIVANSNVTLIAKRDSTALSETTKTLSNWTMRGTFKSISALDITSIGQAGKEVYYISNNSILHAANTFKVPAFRCWFEMSPTSQEPGGMGSSAQRSFSIWVDDMEEVNLDEIITDNEDGTVQMDLLGRRVGQQKSGQIYVVNNKKIYTR